MSDVVFCGASDRSPSVALALRTCCATRESATSSLHAEPRTKSTKHGALNGRGAAYQSTALGAGGTDATSVHSIPSHSRRRKRGNWSRKRAGLRCALLAQAGSIRVLLKWSQTPRPWACNGLRLTLHLVRMGPSSVNLRSEGPFGSLSLPRVVRDLDAMSANALFALPYGEQMRCESDVRCCQLVARADLFRCQKA